MMNKVKIPNMEDRATMASILAVAGYVVWIEEETDDTGFSVYSKNYYVCWKVRENGDEE